MSVFSKLNPFSKSSKSQAPADSSPEVLDKIPEDPAAPLPPLKPTLKEDVQQQLEKMKDFVLKPFTKKKSSDASAEPEKDSDIDVEPTIVVLPTAKKSFTLSGFADKVTAGLLRPFKKASKASTPSQADGEGLASDVAAAAAGEGVTPPPPIKTAFADTASGGITESEKEALQLAFDIGV
jgi:hypothetical protein